MHAEQPPIFSPTEDDAMMIMSEEFRLELHGEETVNACGTPHILS